MDQWEGNGNALQYSCEPGKYHGHRILVGCSPWGHKDLDMTEQLNNNKNMDQRTLPVTFCFLFFQIPSPPSPFPRVISICLEGYYSVYTKETKLMKVIQRFSSLSILVSLNLGGGRSLRTESHQIPRVGVRTKDSLYLTLLLVPTTSRWSSSDWCFLESINAN